MRMTLGLEDIIGDWLEPSCYGKAGFKETDKPEMGKSNSR